MSQWLASILEQQASLRAGEGKSQDLVPALTIEHRGLRYVSDFSHLSEVIENGLIVPYPERHNAHIGIMNIRGSIVPVICLATLFSHDKSKCQYKEFKDETLLQFPRMVVFCSTPGSFAVGAETVRKCLVPRETMENGREIELDGKVYRILNESFFQQLEEMVA